MKAKSLLGWFGLSIAIVAVGYFLKARAAIQQARTALAAVAQQQQRADAEAQRLEKAIAAIERKNRERPVSPDEPPPNGQNSSKRPANRRLAALIKNPKLQIEYLAARKANLGAIYGPLFREMNLSADQIERFEDIVMHREEQRLDLAGADPATMQSANFFVDSHGRPVFSVGNAYSSDGSDGQNQAAIPLLGQVDQDFQGAQIGLLGAAGYQQVAQFERTLPVRGMVDDLISQLSTNLEPISTATEDQLAQILAKSSPSFQSGRDAQLYDIEWDQALPQARSLLSPEQYGELESLSAPQRFLSSVVAVLQETKAAANGPLPAP